MNPIAPAENRSVELVAMATTMSALSWPLHRLSLLSVFLFRVEFQRGHSDVMEVLLFIAAGSRCTLVSMNKRRAGSKINNEHAELKLEAAESLYVCG